MSAAGGEILIFLVAGGETKNVLLLGWNFIFICCQVKIPKFSAAGSKIWNFNIAGKKSKNFPLQNQNSSAAGGEI